MAASPLEQASREMELLQERVAALTSEKQQLIERARGEILQAREKESKTREEAASQLAGHVHRADLVAVEERASRAEGELVMTQKQLARMEAVARVSEQRRVETEQGLLKLGSELQRTTMELDTSSKELAAIQAKVGSWEVRRDELVLLLADGSQTLQKCEAWQGKGAGLTAGLERQLGAAMADHRPLFERVAIMTDQSAMNTGRVREVCLAVDALTSQLGELLQLHDSVAYENEAARHAAIDAMQRLQIDAGASHERLQMHLDAVHKDVSKKEEELQQAVAAKEQLEADMQALRVELQAQGEGKLQAQSEQLAAELTQRLEGQQVQLKQQMQAEQTELEEQQLLREQTLNAKLELAREHALQKDKEGDALKETLEALERSKQELEQQLAAASELQLQTQSQLHQAQADGEQSEGRLVEARAKCSELLERVDELEENETSRTAEMEALDKQVKHLEARCKHGDSELHEARMAIAERDDRWNRDSAALENAGRDTAIQLQNLEQQKAGLELEHRAYCRVAEEEAAVRAKLADDQVRVLEQRLNANEMMHKADRDAIAKAHQQERERLLALHTEAERTWAAQEQQLLANCNILKRECHKDLQTAAEREVDARSTAASGRNLALLVRQRASSGMREQLNALKADVAGMLGGMKGQFNWLQSQLQPLVQRLLETDLRCAGLQSVAETVVRAVDAEVPLDPGMLEALFSGDPSVFDAGIQMLRNELRAAVLTAGASKQLSSIRDPEVFAALRVMS